MCIFLEISKNIRIFRIKNKQIFFILFISKNKRFGGIDLLRTSSGAQRKQRHCYDFLINFLIYLFYAMHPFFNFPGHYPHYYGKNY
jgi:hypothetical protein